MSLKHLKDLRLRLLLFLPFEELFKFVRSEELYQLKKHIMQRPRPQNPNRMPGAWERGHFADLTNKQLYKLMDIMGIRDKQRYILEFIMSRNVELNNNFSSIESVKRMTDIIINNVDKDFSVIRHVFDWSFMADISENIISQKTGKIIAKKYNEQDQYSIFDRWSDYDKPIGFGFFSSADFGQNAYQGSEITDHICVAGTLIYGYGGNDVLRLLYNKGRIWGGRDDDILLSFYAKTIMEGGAGKDMHIVSGGAAIMDDAEGYNYMQASPVKNIELMHPKTKKIINQRVYSDSLIVMRGNNVVVCDNGSDTLFFPFKSLRVDPISPNRFKTFIINFDCHQYSRDYIYQGYPYTDKNQLPNIQKIWRNAVNSMKVVRGQAFKNMNPVIIYTLQLPNQDVCFVYDDLAKKQSNLQQLLARFKKDILYKVCLTPPGVDVQKLKQDHMAGKKMSWDREYSWKGLGMPIFKKK